MKEKWFLVKDFGRELYSIFIKQRPTQLAAALAFYGLFSFAPLLFVAKSIAQVFIGIDINESLFVEQVEKVLGPQAVPIIQKAVDKVASSTSTSSWLTSAISIVVIIFAALGLVFEVQYSLNRIWEAPRLVAKTPGAFIEQQLLRFLMVIGLGFLMVAATAINFILSWLGLYVQLDASLQLINSLILLGLSTLAYASVYKVLPNETIGWGDVWLGGFLAAILMILGGIVFGIYIRVSHLGSTFEAAGVFIVILVGMYYLAQIFLFGAMFTRVYAVKFGSKQHHPKMVLSDTAAHSPRLP